MHGIHKILWEYQDFIRDKNLTSIKISKDSFTITTRNGIVLACDSEDKRAAPMEILNFGDYEADEMWMMRRFLTRKSIVLDVGANIGWYSLNLSRCVPEGRIIAFEPVKKTFDYLKKNISINNIKNVQPQNFGLSDKEGIFEFYYDPKLSSATSLKDLYENRKKKKIRCCVKRLDDFILNITPRIDFIKCDVEGAELLVIRGAFKTLEKMKPVLFLEMLRKWSAKFGYHPNEIINLLDKIGYRCYYIKAKKLMKINKINEKTKPTNFYFLDSRKHIEFLKELS